MARKSNHQCPHCTSSMSIRTSKNIHPLFRILYFQCSNFKCGFTCSGNLEITHQISPSAAPNLNIQLKTLDQISAERKASNDEYKKSEDD
ncbi:ogr/Delta-like zinc finger family protein [Acinetobacter sichuanensis]|uniref:Ogr/Delta-like zinc finger family protein n=1 Tax=Acinetobacter sichuanensis TaxID=2136183 RepID=A0A371YQN8_9GAMM|nr:ogr/Delta-like zinc finger family protein [Acinetobacter sichuanensis]RFC83786.1 hypothetical protein C9E89_009520 [Acinetobacter sichuanensis]